MLSATACFITLECWPMRLSCCTSAPLAQADKRVSNICLKSLAQLCAYERCAPCVLKLQHLMRGPMPYASPGSEASKSRTSSCLRSLL